jgi:hypothetical protein
MSCYVGAEHGVEQPAVALCRTCSAGLCLEHLRQTAARLQSDGLLTSRHHDTWSAPSRRNADAGSSATVPERRPVARRPGSAPPIRERRGWRMRARGFSRRG